MAFFARFTVPLRPIHTPRILLPEHAPGSFLHVSVHTKERFQVRSICPGSLLPNIYPAKYRGAFCGVERLLPRMKYTREIFGIHGGALLPERAPGACSGSKIPRVYRPLYRPISKLLYVTTRDHLEISRRVFTPNITYKSYYYLFMLLPANGL